MISILVIVDQSLYIFPYFHLIIFFYIMQDINITIYLAINEHYRLIKLSVKFSSERVP